MPNREPVVVSAMDASESILLEPTEQFEFAARILDLETWIVRRLRHPEREITANLLVRDDTQPLICSAYSVQHSTVLGPCLSLLTFGSDVNVGELRASAMKRTWQTGLLGLPLGGGAGAIICDPKEMSECQVRQMVKEYGAAMRDGSDCGRQILMPEGSFAERAASWLLPDSTPLVSAQLAAVTGKPRALFGIDGATIVGETLKTLAELAGTSLKGKTAVIEGFGQTAAAAFFALEKAGVRVIAVSDTSGAIYNSKGLDFASLREHVARSQVLFGFAQAESIPTAQLPGLACDLLLLTTDCRQLGAEECKDVRAEVVIEAGEGAISAAAEERLTSAGMHIVPDLLGTCGRVLAAFVEWNRNSTGSYLSHPDLDSHVGGHVERTWQKIAQEAQRHQLTFRQACTVVGVRTVAEALRWH